MSPFMKCHPWALMPSWNHQDVEPDQGGPQLQPLVSVRRSGHYLQSPASGPQMRTAFCCFVVWAMVSQQRMDVPLVSWKNLGASWKLSATYSLGVIMQWRKKSPSAPDSSLGNHKRADSSRWGEPFLESPPSRPVLPPTQFLKIAPVGFWWGHHTTG